MGSGFSAGNTGNAAQFKNQTINIIRVDPANSRVVYVSIPRQSRGLYGVNRSKR